MAPTGNCSPGMIQTSTSRERLRLGRRPALVAAAPGSGHDRLEGNVDG